jgi:hypothetical protein
MKKGQFNVEYLTGLLVFIAFTIYLVFQVGNIIPGYHTQSVMNTLREEAFRVTEVMIKGEGEAWSLGSKPYELESSKVNTFLTECNNNYENKKRELDLSLINNFYFDYEPCSGTCSCGKRIPSGTDSVSLERNVVVDGNLGRIRFVLW